MTGDKKPLMETAKREDLFDRSVELAAQIEDLKTIFQNEMPITSEMVRDWMGDFQVLTANLNRFRDDAFRYLVTNANAPENPDG